MFTSEDTMSAVWFATSIVIFCAFSNTASAISCYSCDSLDDSNCVGNVASMTPSPTCGVCKTVTTTSTVKRECLSSGCSPSATVECCSTDSCNNETKTVPDLLQCFVCDGSLCKTITSATQKTTVYDDGSTKACTACKKEVTTGSSGAITNVKRACDQKNSCKESEWDLFGSKTKTTCCHNNLCNNDETVEEEKTGLECYICSGMEKEKNCKEVNDKTETCSMGLQGMQESDHFRQRLSHRNRTKM